MAGAGRARRTFIHPPRISWRGDIVVYRDRFRGKSGGAIVPGRPVPQAKARCVHMDETRHDAARAAARRPWPAGGPQAGQPGGSRWDARPDLRVSDAERDAVVAELGEHFQQGRLDQAEFDERLTRALSPRTGPGLGGPLAGLPPARAESPIPQPA